MSSIAFIFVCENLDSKNSYCLGPAYLHSLVNQTIKNYTLVILAWLLRFGVGVVTAMVMWSWTISSCGKIMSPCMTLANQIATSIFYPCHRHLVIVTRQGVIQRGLERGRVKSPPFLPTFIFTKMESCKMKLVVCHFFSFTAMGSNTIRVRYV